MLFPTAGWGDRFPRLTRNYHLKHAKVPPDKAGTVLELIVANRYQFSYLFWRVRFDWLLFRWLWLDIREGGPL